MNSELSGWDAHSLFAESANANRARERDALPDGLRQSDVTDRLIDEAET